VAAQHDFCRGGTVPDGAGEINFKFLIFSFELLIQAWSRSRPAKNSKLKTLNCERRTFKTEITARAAAIALSGEQRHPFDARLARGAAIDRERSCPHDECEFRLGGIDQSDLRLSGNLRVAKFAQLGTKT
jgi:hypothetical protein